MAIRKKGNIRLLETDSTKEVEDQIFAENELIYTVDTGIYKFGNGQDIYQNLSVMGSAPKNKSTIIALAPGDPIVSDLANATDIASIRYLTQEEYDALPVKSLHTIYITRGYVPELLAIIDYATTAGYTLPGELDLRKLNTLIRNLKSDNIWNRLDLLYIFANSGDDNFRTLNYKNPASFKGDKLGGLVNTVNGYEGNGTNGYIKTNFSGSSSGVNYLQNDASRICYAYKASTDSSNANLSVIDGVESFSPNRFSLGNTATHRINQENVNLASPVDMSGTGYRAIQRNIAANLALIKDGALTTYAALSTPRHPSPQTIFRSAVSSWSTIGLSFYAMGGALTLEQHNAFRTHFINYLQES